jgi:hypothetical protein
MKHQIPTSKLQRSSKNQAPKSLIDIRQLIRYSAPSDTVLLLNEAPAENGATRHPFEGVSKKDFHNTISRCVKEAKETKHVLRMIAASEPKLAEQGRELYREAKELHLIFASIFRR